MKVYTADDTTTMIRANAGAKKKSLARKNIAEDRSTRIPAQKSLAKKQTKNKNYTDEDGNTKPELEGFLQPAWAQDFEFFTKQKVREYVERGVRRVA